MEASWENSVVLIVVWEMCNYSICEAKSESKTFDDELILFTFSSTLLFFKLIFAFVICAFVRASYKIMNINIYIIMIRRNAWHNLCVCIL